MQTDSPWAKPEHRQPWGHETEDLCNAQKASWDNENDRLKREVHARINGILKKNKQTSPLTNIC